MRSTLTFVELGGNHAVWTSLVLKIAPERSGRLSVPFTDG
jgi:hypothetical protein